jgi:chemotaxis protein histidine kinase CheA
VDRRRLLELFLGESRDHLSAAYETLEGMQGGSRDSDALPDLMRHAHSLKGMAMSLGFSPMESLAHALEDLFESLRQAPPRRLRALAPLALDRVSCLGGIVDSVERSGTAAPNGARELAARIRAAERESSPNARSAADQDGASAAGKRAVPSMSATGPLRSKIELLLYNASSGTATQTVAVLRSLDELGRVEHVDPPLAAGRTGRFEGRLVLILRSGVPAPELERRLRAIPEVA